MEDDAKQHEGAAAWDEDFDYGYVPHTARIAVYEDMKMPPHVIEVPPAPTALFIETLASRINDEKLKLGGKIPYSAIREVSENFIHARFSEIVVSILEGGNTIRFCDQGPGIQDKDKATLPGYTSAVEPMKRYIRGVGSGLPLVKEYMDFSGGRITIEDNIKAGSVVTISLCRENEPAVSGTTPLAPSESSSFSEGPHGGYDDSRYPRLSNPRTPDRVGTAPFGDAASFGNASADTRSTLPPLTEREKTALSLLASKGPLGVKDLSQLQGLANSSAHALFKKMEEHGLVEQTINKKRMLTAYGQAICRQLFRI